MKYKMTYYYDFKNFILSLHDGECTQKVRVQPDKKYLLLVFIKNCPPTAGILRSFQDESERKKEIDRLELTDGYWCGELPTSQPTKELHYENRIN